MKLNNIASAEEIRKQALEKVAHRIDVYLMENSITTIKFYTTWTLPNRDVTIQITSIEKAKNLREEDDWTKVLRSKAKLT